MMEFPQSFMSQFVRNSCYLFSLGKAVEILMEKEMSAHSILDVALSSYNVSDSGYVKDANAFIREIMPSEGLIIVQKEKEIPVNPKCMAMVAITHYQDEHSRHHFRISKELDTLRYDCDAVKEGRIVDYRIVMRML